MSSGEPSWDAEGGLGIKERRSWANWQLAVAAFVAMLLGMAIGHTGNGGNSQASGGGSSGFQLPPQAGTSALSTPTSISAPATTSAQPSTATSAAPSTPTTAAPAQSSVSVAGPGTVLFPRTTGSGGQTLAGFSASGPWKLGWAFQCTSAPGLQILVVSDGGPSPGQPAVERTDLQGQGVAEMSTTGRQHLEVRAAPSCRWAVKASGAG